MKARIIIKHLQEKMANLEDRLARIETETPFVINELEEQIVNVGKRAASFEGEIADRLKGRLDKLEYESAWHRTLLMTRFRHMGQLGDDAVKPFIPPAAIPKKTKVQ